jgi:hypothetical protein
MSSDSPRTIKMRPAGCPDWMTPDLIEETVEVWSPYYPNGLTEADAVEILRAVGMLSDVIERKVA